MSKSRNSKTLRKQEYPDPRDDEDSDDTDLFDTPPAPRKAAPAHVPVDPETARYLADFKEGALVTCPDTVKNKEGGTAMTTGTIVQALHGEASVLDGAGYIHRVKLSQVYLAQN